MTTESHLILSNLTLTLVMGGSDIPLRPVVQGGEARLTNAGFVTIVQQALGERIELPRVTLEFVSCRLIDGGAELTVRAKRSFIDQQARACVLLEPAGNGDLRMTIAEMKVGMFGAAWLLEFVLSAVNRVPGLRQAGPRAIDINIPALLASRDIPVDIAPGVGVSDVRALPEELVITLR